MVRLSVGVRGGEGVRERERERDKDERILVLTLRGIDCKYHCLSSQ